MSCIFCQIIAGTAEGSVVYETDETLAFLDIHQFNPGHVLIVPKEHFENIWDIPRGMNFITAKMKLKSTNTI